MNRDYVKILLQEIGESRASSDRQRSVMFIVEDQVTLSFIHWDKWSLKSLVENWPACSSIADQISCVIVVIVVIVAIVVILVIVVIAVSVVIVVGSGKPNKAKSNYPQKLKSAFVVVNWMAWEKTWYHFLRDAWLSCRKLVKVETVQKFQRNVEMFGFRCLVMSDGAKTCLGESGPGVRGVWERSGDLDPL